MCSPDKRGKFLLLFTENPELTAAYLSNYAIVVPFGKTVFVLSAIG